MSSRISARASRIIVGFCVVFAVNNFLPYLGLRFLSCQTMFSGLQNDNLEHTNNHLFLPQWPLSDIGQYFRVSAHLKDADSWKPTAEEKYLLHFFDGERKLNVLNVRVITRELCQRNRLGDLTLWDLRNRKIELPNVCATSFPNEYRWIPFQLFATDYNDEMRAPLEAWSGQ